MSSEATGAVYWDSSAVLSALFRDGHSDEASTRARSSDSAFAFRAMKSLSFKPPRPPTRALRLFW